MMIFGGVGKSVCLTLISVCNNNNRNNNDINTEVTSRRKCFVGQLHIMQLII